MCFNLNASISPYREGRGGVVNNGLVPQRSMIVICSFPADGDIYVNIYVNIVNIYVNT